MVFETPCGLVCKSSFAQQEQLFRGEEEWSLEAKRPLIPCYEAGNCDKTPEVPKMLGVCSACVTARTWNYEESCEKKQDLYNERKNRALREFISGFIAAKGFVPCPRQLYYDGEKWNWQNDPLICVESCKRKETMVAERFCPMMEKALSKKTGNLYFDIRVKDTVFRDIRIHHKPFLLDIAYYMRNHQELISNYLEQIAWEYLHNHKINKNDYTICNIRVKEESVSQLKKIPSGKERRNAMEYKVKWTQTLADVFKVDTSSEEEALETVRSGECGDVDTIIDNRYEIVVDENNEECPCLLVSSDGSEIYHKKFRTVEEARNVMWREAADCCKDAADQQTVLSGSTPLKWEYGYIGMESCHLLSIDSGETIDGDWAWRIAVI